MMIDFNIYYGIGIISVTIASFSQILLKKGAMKEYENWIREYANVYVISGYAMMFGSVFLTILAYRGIENFLVIPLIESIGYILVPILSYFYFKEKLSRKKIIGICLILLGVMVYNL
ncbi:MAG: multidrug ABC transporter [Eubacteriales bacterium]